MTKQKKARQNINEIIEESTLSDEELPFITFQLPVYNEAEVIERLMISAAEVDYPKDKFEIQVVDDSTDETVFIIDRFIDSLKKKYDVDVYAVRRKERIGYKAGALENAMKVCKGEFIAIFDSDFIIPKNYLRRTVPQILKSENNACIQGRWGHLNKEENWLTRAQSVGLDGHFAAEQGARSYGNMCMNFNGTAGIWRKKAINDAGGWEHDTLTEDLDLSYRVQMAGYKIVYDFDLVCYAELPNNIHALKSQQKRWAKGSMETAIKLMGDIFKSKLSFIQKIEAFFHLTHYSVAFFMLMISLLTLPVILYAPEFRSSISNYVFILMFLGAFAPGVMYAGSGYVIGHTKFSIKNFPSVLVMGSGLCLNNLIAVLEAIRGKKSEFVRTPKSGSTENKKKSGRYKANLGLLQGCGELLLGIYGFITLIFYIQTNNIIFSFFIFLYTLGLLFFGTSTITSYIRSLTFRETESNIDFENEEPAID
jgi:cellulose synthase/poly-beta-1,6-N-acetylglucosamine synthase-like glycosyltransferase